MLTETARNAAAAVTSLLVVGCIGGSDDDGDTSEVVEEVGQLVTVAGGGEVSIDDVVAFNNSAPAEVELHDVSEMAAGPAGQIWVVIGGFLADVSGPEVDLEPSLPGRTSAAEIAVDSDGALYLGQFERTTRQVFRLHDGELTTIPADAVTRYSELAVGPDGTVFLADPGGVRPESQFGRVVELAPDGTVTTVVEEHVSGPIAVSSDGTVYFVRAAGRRLAPYGLVAMDPDSGVQASVTTVGTDRAPRDGARVESASLSIHDVAASGDGIYLLAGTTETQDVWRIEDGVLHLELRRSRDGPTIVDITVAPNGRVYVLDLQGRISAIK